MLASSFDISERGRRLLFDSNKVEKERKTLSQETTRLAYPNEIFFILHLFNRYLRKMKKITEFFLIHFSYSLDNNPDILSRLNVVKFLEIRYFVICFETESAWKE